MAPEQIEGHPRAASDQYALGVVAYEWLCGARPFEGSLTEVMVQHLTMPPPPLHEKVATIPPGIEQVVLRALAKNPNERFDSVQDFAFSLQQASQVEVGAGSYATQQATPFLTDERVQQRLSSSKPELPWNMPFGRNPFFTGRSQLLERLHEQLSHSKSAALTQSLETVSAATRTAAQQLVEQLDGLPLALDQAGAYIEETECSLSDYLALYTRRRLALLKRKTSIGSDYPHTVASTWTLSFSKIEQADPRQPTCFACARFCNPMPSPKRS
jgi:serine/threonine protein kinase